jgi:hypothetical protein
MPLTSSILAGLCAFCLSSAAPSSPSRPPDTLAVRVNLRFDRSITSDLIKTVLKEEAAAIWNPYGVDLLWSDGDGGAAPHFDVIVARHQRGAVLNRSEVVLGITTIDRSGVVCGPIRIWLDTIESLFQQGHINALLRDREMATALGRVLAHELGHALLGVPTYHDRAGLMRAAFDVDDLARLDRRRFQLTDGTVGRLRARIEQLTDAQRPDICSPREESD